MKLSDLRIVQIIPLLFVFVLSVFTPSYKCAPENFPSPSNGNDIDPARKKPSWQHLRAHLDSVGHTVAPKEFVQYLRQYVYETTPLLSTGGVQSYQYFGDPGWPRKAALWHDIVYDEILGSVCGDFANQLMAFYHEFGFKSWTLNLGKPELDDNQGHMQTIVEVIDAFNGKLDTILSIQDAEFNFTYFDHNGELIDLRDILRLWLTGEGKDSVFVKENETYGISLLTAPDSCECCDKFIRYQHSRVPGNYLGYGVRKLVKPECFDDTYTDIIPYSYGYGHFKLEKTSDFSQQYYFIRDIVDDNGTDQPFLEVLDSLKLLYGFIPWNGIARVKVKVDSSQVFAGLDSMLLECSSFRDSLMELLLFAHNEIRLGDPVVPMDSGYHSSGVWVHLFEQDAIRVDEKGEVRFFNSLCNRVGLQAGELYIGKELTPAMGFSVVQDPNSGKGFLFNPRFMIFFQDHEGELVDVIEQLKAIKNKNRWAIELATIPEYKSYGNYLTTDSTMWYYGKNPFMVKRRTYVRHSPQPHLYRIISERSLNTFLLRGGKAVMSGIADWHHDDFPIIGPSDMSVVPAYCILTVGLPDSLKSRIDSLLAIPF